MARSTHGHADAFASEPDPAVPPHLQRARQAVETARAVAARYRATYVDAPQSWTPPERRAEPPRPERQEPSHSVRLMAPKEKPRRRLDLADAPVKPLEAPPAPVAEPTRRFARVHDAIRDDGLAESGAEPWSHVLLDAAPPAPTSGWTRLVQFLRRAARRPVAALRGYRRRDRASGRGADPSHTGPVGQRHGEPFPPCKPRPVRASPRESRGRPAAPNGSHGGRERGASGGGAEADELADISGFIGRRSLPAPLAISPAAAPDECACGQPLSGFRQRATVRNGLSAGNGARELPLLSSPSHPELERGQGAAGPAAPEVIAPGLPARRAAHGRRAARTPARLSGWRLISRTLLMAGLGVLCGALLAEFADRWSGSVTGRAVEERPPQPRSARPASAAQVTTREARPPRAPDRRPIMDSARPRAEHAQAPGPKPAARALDEIAAGTPKSAVPHPVAAPPRADRAAIEGALRLARQEVALAELARLIEADPRRWDAFYELGHQLQVRDHLPEALALFREAARLDPSHPATFYDWGFALQKQGDQAGAIEKYRAAIELGSKNPYVYYNLGFLLQRSGDVKGAIENYRRAAELDHKNPFIYYNWGNLLEARGDIESAIALYLEASRLEPDAWPGTDARSRIAALSRPPDGLTAR